MNRSSEYLKFRAQRQRESLRLFHARKRIANREPIADAPAPVEILDYDTDEFLERTGW